MLPSAFAFPFVALVSELDDYVGDLPPGLQNACCCRMMRPMSDLMRLKQTSGKSMISIIEIIKTTLPAGPEGRD
jgi:hypothetical protein